MPPRSDRKPEGIEAREELFSPFGPCVFVELVSWLVYGLRGFPSSLPFERQPGLHKMSRYRGGRGQEDPDKGYPVDELGIARR
jgi:hypothetical protein